MESMHIYQGAQNALDEFRDGNTELLGYSVARSCDLAASRNQDVRAALRQAQRRLSIRLERSTVSTSSVTNRVLITLTSTISMASHIFKSMFPAVFSPGTGANCKRSTPAKSASWPMFAAVPRAPLMAPMMRYKACVSIKLVERNGRTERVWVYPSACSIGIVPLPFKLPH
jgi:hypothetical protein